jgi:hypothetical protein
MQKLFRVFLHLFISFPLIVFSQSNFHTELKSFLKNVDKVEVVCSSKVDTSKYFLTRVDLINICRDAAINYSSYPQKNKSSIARGAYIYYSNSQPIFKVELTDPGIRFTFKDQVITSLSSYEADMLFIETCNSHTLDSLNEIK